MVSTSQLQVYSKACSRTMMNVTKELMLGYIQNEKLLHMTSKEYCSCWFHCCERYVSQQS
jgi:hypothetical protein